MNRLAKWLAVPILVVVGLAVVGPQSAEAARWRRFARRGVYAHRHYYHVGPPIVRAPRVHVYAPGVGVYVDPWYGRYYWGPGYRNWGPGYGYYGYYGYYGW